MAGGRPSMGSLHTGDDTIRHPALPRRVYQPSYWNRKGERRDGDAVRTCNPVFARYRAG